MQKASAPKVQGFFAAPPPIGSAKAWQRRWQSRFLSWFADEIHEKERAALQGFFAGPPLLGPPRRGSAAVNPVSCPGLQLSSMRKRGLPYRASQLGQMAIPVLCKLLWGQRSHCFLLRRNCKRRGWTPRATSASNQSAPARLQIPLMLSRYSSRSF